MSLVRLARRYAKALFELAAEEDAVDRIRTDLDAVAAVLEESPDLRDVLTSPAQSTGLRKAVFLGVAERLGTGPEVRNLVQLLVDRNRILVLDDLIRVYRELVDEARGEVQGEVETARPLSEEQLASLRVKLAALTGRKVVLTVRERPDLIGGLVARVGNTVYDASLATRLDTLKRTMIEGG